MEKLRAWWPYELPGAGANDAADEGEVEKKGLKPAPDGSERAEARMGDGVIGLLLDRTDDVEGEPLNGLVPPLTLPVVKVAGGDAGGREAKAAPVGRLGSWPDANESESERAWAGGWWSGVGGIAMGSAEGLWLADM